MYNEEMHINLFFFLLNEANSTVDVYQTVM